MLRHPCVLGGPETRGQSQRWPTSGRKCYVTPTFLGVPKKGLKSGPHRAPEKNPMVENILVLKDHPASLGQWKKAQAGDEITSGQQVARKF